MTGFDTSHSEAASDSHSIVLGNFFPTSASGPHTK